MLVQPDNLGQPSDDAEATADDADTLTTTRVDVARTDIPLLSMVDHAREVLAAESIETEPEFLLRGFSVLGRPKT
jgi:hypothetical protein